ncbi:DUF3619 domain-containing protein [Burkholderia sp. WAC0059]|uniref:DUF3619 family protein n=1 Tax=Burkholderia sp. WAC0059 TaxID=2066022 RepID=UPI000C7EB09F|nr:DUF3619 family protein [Burkholderia sp. WAC0059]PLZ01081.1 DUF3619 domain-containing protein [Burkholderia sp. WAC0059]
MSSALETKELEFARELRRALDENAARIAPAAAARLAAARQVALTRKKTAPESVRVAAPVFVMAGVPAGLPAQLPRRRSPLARFVLAWPLVALVAGIFFIAYWENQQRAAELADIDAAMLSDDLPLTAYLDHGFNAYLSRTH